LNEAKSPVLCKKLIARSTPRSPTPAIKGKSAHFLSFGVLLIILEPPPAKPQPSRIFEDSFPQKPHDRLAHLCHIACLNNIFNNNRLFVARLSNFQGPATGTVAFPFVSSWCVSPRWRCCPSDRSRIVSYSLRPIVLVPVLPGLAAWLPGSQGTRTARIPFWDLKFFLVSFRLEVTVYLEVV